ncbi:MAG: D-tyrosyl-tRNA(Tyr) deacylase [Bacteroidales bacterium]|nr:D-tyrosyl-tRNA(Tyr) deacylase [Bacteroidales bacterium]
MRAVIQRVQYAKITINQAVEKQISTGMSIFLGIEPEDSEEDITWLAGKIARLRIFSDAEGKMNLSIQDIHGEALVVSQFTLHASIKKGNRPSWIRAADPPIAQPMYNKFVIQLQQLIQKKVVTGEFGAHMEVELLNDGPVTLIIDTKNKE